MRKNVDKNFGPLTLLFSRGGAGMCFFIYIFCFSPNTDEKNRVFKRILESWRNLKKFFQNFRPFFPEFWRFENLERPFCKKISEVQSPFFNNKVCYLV